MSLPPAGGFTGDDGRADPALVAALAAGDESAAMRLLANARLLTPVVPLPEEERHRPDHDDSRGHGHEHGHGEPHGHGHGHDERHGPEHDHGGAPMATVSIHAPDGRRAMLAFTGLEALACWDPAARPLPVTAVYAAGEALREGFDALILDRDAPHESVLRRPMLQAIAEGLRWTPPHEDPVVHQAVAAAASEEPAVRAWSVDSGPPGSGAIVITLTLAPGLTEVRLHAALDGIGQRFAADAAARALVEGVHIRLRQG